MVVGLDKTKGSTFSEAMELLKNSPIVVFGVIVNGSKDHDTRLNNTYKAY
jgi:Mrp family chromosome partitioning ATPase